MACQPLRSCLCCGLPAGVLAIGIICLVLNGMGIIFMSVVLGSPDLVRREFEKQIYIEENLALVGYDRAALVEHCLYVVRVLFGIGLFVMVACALLDIGLLLGNSKSWPRPLLAWVIGYSLTTVGAIGYCLFLATQLAQSGQSGMGAKMTWFYIIAHLGISLAFIYFILVVFSYYRVLRDRESGGAYAMTPKSFASS